MKKYNGTKPERLVKYYPVKFGVVDDGESVDVVSFINDKMLATLLKESQGSEDLSVIENPVVDEKALIDFPPFPIHPPSFDARLVAYDVLCDSILDGIPLLREYIHSPYPSVSAKARELLDISIQMIDPFLSKKSTDGVIRELEYIEGKLGRWARKIETPETIEDVMMVTLSVFSMKLIEVSTIWRGYFMGTAFTTYRTTPATTSGTTHHYSVRTNKSK